MATKTENKRSRSASSLKQRKRKPANKGTRVYHRRSGKTVTSKLFSNSSLFSEKNEVELETPDIMDMVESSLEGLSGLIDVKTTIREFDELRYPSPKEYGPEDIVKLREKTLKLSQAAFAMVCNTKPSTLQKWESGVNNPTPPIHRLFQLIERGGLKTIEQ